VRAKGTFQFLPRASACPGAPPRPEDDPALVLRVGASADLIWLKRPAFSNHYEGEFAPFIVKESGLLVSNRPTWYFGDGASILSNVVGTSHPIAPLDAILTSAASAQRTGASFGVTVSPSLSAPYRLNRSIDGARSGPSYTAGASRALS
jgi:hypothetical protein